MLKGLEQNPSELIDLIGKAYEYAFMNALRHKPNGQLVDEFATLTWLAGSDYIPSQTPWMQYGMPRIRRMARELNLPWIPTAETPAVVARAKRMANGLPCQPKCLRCFKGR